MTLEAQAEIAHANAESEEMKKRREEQERLADLKVNEYMKQKAAREASFEAEQEKIRIEKEKEIARLRAQQVRYCCIWCCWNILYLVVLLWGFCPCFFCVVSCPILSCFSCLILWCPCFFVEVKRY